MHRIYDCGIKAHRKLQGVSAKGIASGPDMLMT